MFIHPNHQSLLALAAAVVVSSPTAAPGQNIDQEFLDIPRITGEVTLDGVPSERFWATIDPLPMTVHAPVYGGPPTESTRIWLAHDDDHLYLAGELHDSRTPRAYSLTRDRLGGGDLVELIVDSYLDRENAVAFAVNPSGVRIDFSVANDGQRDPSQPGNSAIDLGWNAFWDAETRMTDERWTFEIRVPFSTLRFQDRDGTVQMGLIVRRYLARENESATLDRASPIP